MHKAKVSHVYRWCLIVYAWTKSGFCWWTRNRRINETQMRRYRRGYENEWTQKHLKLRWGNMSRESLDKNECVKQAKGNKSQQNKNGEIRVRLAFGPGDDPLFLLCCFIPEDCCHLLPHPLSCQYQDPMFPSPHYTHSLYTHTGTFANMQASRHICI